MSVLINCRTCNNEVSSTARMCPHCGESSPEPYKDKLLYTVIGIVVVIMIVYPLVTLANWLLW